MNNNLITVNNVRGYIDENNVAWLNLEDVCKELGFIQFKNDKIYLRTDRIKKYLEELNFPTSGENLPEYIPEQITYLLAMKSKNEIGRNFQYNLAFKILPEIRKNGFYISEKSKLKEIEQKDKELNIRTSELINKISEGFKGLIHEKLLKAKAIEILTGDKNLLPPIQIEKTYSATELGELVEISYKMVGILANKYNLKNNENTIVTIAMDKTGTDRETYRYKEHCVELFKEKYKNYLEEKLAEKEQKNKNKQK